MVQAGKTGGDMKLERADELARWICKQLGPHCDRIAVAGSVRRRKPECGDVEIVCIPKTTDSVDLFGCGSELMRIPDFIKTVHVLGVICKGNPRIGKYMQLMVSGEQLDLFTATPENWGLIFAIRTGSADFSHQVLACGWVKAGYTSRDGLLCWCGLDPVPVREEVDLFKLIGVPWVEPERR